MDVLEEMGERDERQPLLAGLSLPQNAPMMILSDIDSLRASPRAVVAVVPGIFIAPDPYIICPVPAQSCQGRRRDPARPDPFFRPAPSEL